MSDATAMPWEWVSSKDDRTLSTSIHIEDSDGTVVARINDAPLAARYEYAKLIVRDHNAHVALVEALEATRHSLIDMGKSAYGPQLQYEIGVITAALEAVGSRNGEAKR